LKQNVIAADKVANVSSLSSLQSRLDVNTTDNSWQHGKDRSLRQLLPCDRLGAAHSFRELLDIPSNQISLISGSLSPRHGASSGYGWRNGHKNGG